MCILFPGFNRIWSKTKPSRDHERNRKQHFYLGNFINSGMLLWCFYFGLWSIHNRRYQHGTWPRCCGCHRVHILAWQGQRASTFCSLSLLSKVQSSSEQKRFVANAPKWKMVSWKGFTTSGPESRFSFQVLSSEYRKLWASCKLVSFCRWKQTESFGAWSSSLLFVAHLAQINKNRMFVSSLPLPPCQDVTFMNFSTQKEFRHVLQSQSLTRAWRGDHLCTKTHSCWLQIWWESGGMKSQRVGAAGSVLTAGVLSQTPDNLPVVSGRPARTSCGLSELPRSRESAENTPNVSKRSAHRSRTLSSGCLSRRFGTSRAEDRPVSLGSGRVFSPACPDSFHIP